jgi:hypothetical protein
MNELITIHHVCSLGQLCLSSKLCKDTGLKQESYPFDWIFSNPKMIVKILEDNFSKFLNKELYMSKTSELCGHTLYGSNVFNHHNPKDNIEHYNYFTRCVERFRKLLVIERNKLFVLYIGNLNYNLEHIERTKKEIIEFNDYISSKTRNHYLFIIYHIQNQDYYKKNTVDINNIKFLSLYTKCCANGVILPEPENKMLHKLLLESYSFEIKKL